MPRLLIKSELLQVFVEVAERRSFTRAAVALHRTQSAVSMQIRRLESALGVALFVRHAHHVDPTPAGSRLLRHARRMLALNDEAVLLVGAKAEAPALRIGVMEDFAGSVLQPALARLDAGASPAHIQVVTGLTSLMLAQLGTDFDIVIAMHAVGHERGEFLRREQAVWAAGDGCLIDGSEPVSLALYRPGCLLRAWATDGLDAVDRPWRLRFVGETAQTVQLAAARGKWLTVVKAGMFPVQLRRVPARHGLPRLPAADVRLHRAPGLPRASRLLGDRLVEALQAPPGRGRGPAS